MKRFQLTIVLLLATVTVASAQGKKGGKTRVAGGNQNVFLMASGGPVLVRVQAEMNGKTADQLHREFLEKIVAYFDRNGDGVLDAQELKYLPKGNFAASAFRYGGLYVNPGYSLRMADLGKGEQDTVNVDELIRYYSKNQFTPMMSQGMFNAPKSAAAGALFKYLDTDGDGKLSKAELLAARKLLKRFDLDGDEYLSPAELVGPGNQFIGGGLQPAQPPGGFGAPISPVQLETQFNGTQIASMIMTRYDKNKDYKLDREESGLDEATFKKLDRDGDGFLSLTEIGHWAEVVPPVTVIVRVGEIKGDLPRVEIAMPKAKLPKGVVVDKAGSAVPYLRIDNAKLAFVEVSRPANNFPGNTNFYMNLFNTARKGKDFVELKDLNTNNQFKILEQAFEMLDRDGDGKLTKAEMDEYFKTLDHGKEAFASFRVQEEGQDLFQILDTNRDGRLSQRELMNAWEVLSAMDRNNDGFITPEEFGHQYVVSVGQGQAAFFGGGNGGVQPGGIKKTGKAAGPKWFQKMDTNGDGDISPREFLGPPELFRKMDLNGDGLIDAEEAWKANEWFVKKGQ